jgi:hypothetical protein
MSDRKALRRFTRPLIPTFTLLCAVVLSSCSSQKGNSSDGSLIGIDKPQPADFGSHYLLLSRQNWIDFDPGRAEETMAAAISGGATKTVLLHDPTVINWANNNADFAVLKSAISRAPAEKVEVARESGQVDGEVVLDKSAAAALGILTYISAKGGSKDFYAFKANLVEYRPTYTFSISKLYSEGLIQDRRFDLRGLPFVYFAFETLSSESGRQLSVEGSGGGDIPAFHVVGQGKFSYDRKSVLSFQNKVFAVDFARDPSYLSDSKYAEFGSPFLYYNIQLGNVERETDQRFLEWRTRAQQFFRLNRYELCKIQDSQNKCCYTLTAWERAQYPWTTTWGDWGPNPRLTLVEEQSDARESTIQWLQGAVTPISPNVPTLASKLDIPAPQRDPYNSTWIVYTPRLSLEIIALDNEWKARSTFVRFVP